MNRRDYAIGIGVGQFMSEQNMSKPDILEFFEKYVGEHCEENCPFAEECARVNAISNDEESICTIFGLE